MNISIILSAIFVPVCVTFLFSALNKSNISVQKTTDKQFIIEIPNVVLVIGLLLDIECVAVVLGFTFLSSELPHIVFYMFFGLGIWLGTYLMLKTLKFKVYVQEDKITVQNFFRRQINFTFSEIVSATRQVKNNQVKSERIVVKTISGQKLIVESTEISYELFLNRIKTEVNSDFLFGFD